MNYQKANLFLLITAEICFMENPNEPKIYLLSLYY